MTSLTDRYVHVTVRGLDDGQRHDVEQELRGTIEDMVDARLDTGAAASGHEAERAVLVELGDPVRLAAGYSGSPLHLIGPAVYPQWSRLVTLLLWVVVPAVTLIHLVVRLFVDDVATDGVGAAFGSAAVVAFHSTVHVVFWTTVVFAVVERTSPSAVGVWDPDQLPEVTAGPQVGLAESAVAAMTIVVTGLALVWQHTSSPVRVDGKSVPVLDPGLWDGWMWVLLALLVGQVVVVGLVHRRRRWTPSLAVGGVLVDLAFAAVVVGLVLADRFFAPAFVDALTRAGWESAGRDLAYSTVLTVVVILVWDQVETWRRVRAAR